MPSIPAASLLVLTRHNARLVFSPSITASISLDSSELEVSFLAVSCPSNIFADSVRYPPGDSISVILVWSLPSSKAKAPIRHCMFRPSANLSGLLCRLLTSVDPSIPPHIRPRFFRIGHGTAYAFSSNVGAFHALSVRQTSNLPAASFRFRLTMATLAVRLAVPIS